ncbi:hypothetical protein H4R34_000079 [Dimargaris verticillata]|uniref:PH domain-containing protein n=1 Tax=Dimargaris verticillata TaxID=2761393 RepID=A0A9W8B5W0_9FUNG|nr:hypothetical protein H4R34_000079 [Dimargaris verticillata]
MAQDYRLPVSIRIYVEDARRYHTVLCKPTSTVRSVLKDLIQRDILTVATTINSPLAAAFGNDPEVGQWALFELINDFDIERPLVDWERVVDVIESWEGCPNNALVVRAYPLRRYLSAQAGLPDTMPEHTGWLYAQMKKQKWQKTKFVFRGADLLHYKDNKSKIELSYTSLDHMQLYTPSKFTRKAHNKFVLALKNESSIKLFEKPELDYVRLLCAPDLQELSDWLIALRCAKNRLMFDQLSPEDQAEFQASNLAAAVAEAGKPETTKPGNATPSQKKPTGTTYYDQLAAGSIATKLNKAPSQSTLATSETSADAQSASAKPATEPRLTATEISRNVLNQHASTASGIRQSDGRTTPSEGSAGDANSPSRTRTKHMITDQDGMYKPGSLLSYDFQQIAEAHKEQRKVQESIVSTAGPQAPPKDAANKDIFLSGSLLASATLEPEVHAPSTLHPSRDADGSGPTPGEPLIKLKTATEHTPNRSHPTMAHNHRNGPLVSLQPKSSQEDANGNLFKPGSLLTRAKSQRTPHAHGERTQVTSREAGVSRSRTIRDNTSFSAADVSAAMPALPRAPLINLGTPSQTKQASLDNHLFTPNSLLTSRSSRPSTQPSQSQRDDDDDDTPLIHSMSRGSSFSPADTNSSEQHPVRTPKTAGVLPSAGYYTRPPALNVPIPTDSFGAVNATLGLSRATSPLSPTRNTRPSSRSSSVSTVSNSGDVARTTGYRSPARGGSRHESLRSSNTSAAPTTSPSSRPTHERGVDSHRSKSRPRVPTSVTDSDEDVPLYMIKEDRKLGRSHTTRVSRPHPPTSHNGSTPGSGGGDSALASKTTTVPSSRPQRSRSQSHSQPQLQSRSSAAPLLGAAATPPVPSLNVKTRPAKQSTRPPLEAAPTPQDQRHRHLKQANSKPLLSFD